MIGLQRCVPVLPCGGLGCQGLPVRPYYPRARARHPNHSPQTTCSYKPIGNRGHGNRKAVPRQPRTPKEPGQDFQFEMPPLPNLEDIKTDRVIRGGLVGTLVGTLSSAVVPSFEASAVAAAAAAIMALVPTFDLKKTSTIADEKNIDVPGKVAATIASEVQQAAEGARQTDEGSAVTVVTSAIVAGSTVSLFAAKSLPLVFAASAIYVASQTDNLDLKSSTTNTRDFLRSRKEGGVGIVISLIALQARGAVDAIASLNSKQGGAVLEPVPVRVTGSEGPLEGTLQQAKATKGKGTGKVADLKGNGQSGPATPLQNLKGAGGTPKDQLVGGPDDSKNPLSTPLQDAKGVAQAPGAETPLQKAKGGKPGVGAGDLTTGPTDFTKKEGVLTADSPATQTPGAGTPLEKVKGENKSAGAGGLSTGPADFSKSKEGLLTKDSPATSTPGSGSPIEKLKGKNTDAPKSDLSTGPVEFPQASATTLSSGSEATQVPGQSSPLESLKGGLQGAGDLVKSGTKAIFEGKSPVSSASASTSPLESLKGKAPQSTPSGGSRPASFQDDKRSQSSLQLKSSQGIGKALQLSGLSPRGAEAAKQAGLADASDLVKNQPSSSGKSIISQPYEIGKTALEQSLPQTSPEAAGQHKRSAARPSEISRLATQGASSLSRPSQDVRRVTGLEKPEAASSAALAFSPKANIAGAGKSSSTSAEPQKKKTLVDKILVLAGTGMFGSLVGVIYFLVQGQTLGHPIPRALLTAVFCCIAAIVLLISLGKHDQNSNTALA